MKFTKHAVKAMEKFAESRHASDKEALEASKISTQTCGELHHGPNSCFFRGEPFDLGVLEDFHNNIDLDIRKVVALYDHYRFNFAGPCQNLLKGLTQQQLTILSGGSLTFVGCGPDETVTIAVITDKSRTFCDANIGFKEYFAFGDKVRSVPPYGTRNCHILECPVSEMLMVILLCYQNSKLTMYAEDPPLITLTIGEMCYVCRMNLSPTAIQNSTTTAMLGLCLVPVDGGFVIKVPESAPVGAGEVKSPLGLSEENKHMRRPTDVGARVDIHTTKSGFLRECRRIAYDAQESWESQKSTWEKTPETLGPLPEPPARSIATTLELTKNLPRPKFSLLTGTGSITYKLESPCVTDWGKKDLTPLLPKTRYCLVDATEAITSHLDRRSSEGINTTILLRQSEQHHKTYGNNTPSIDFGKVSYFANNLSSFWVRFVKPTNTYQLLWGNGAITDKFFPLGHMLNQEEFFEYKKRACEAVGSEFVSPYATMSILAEKGGRLASIINTLPLLPVSDCVSKSKVNTLMENSDTMCEAKSRLEPIMEDFLSAIATAYHTILAKEISLLIDSSIVVPFEHMMENALTKKQMENALTKKQESEPKRMSSREKKLQKSVLAKQIDFYLKRMFRKLMLVLEKPGYLRTCLPNQVESTHSWMHLLKKFRVAAADADTEWEPPYDAFYKIIMSQIKEDNLLSQPNLLSDERPETSGVFDPDDRTGVYVPNIEGSPMTFPFSSTMEDQDMCRFIALMMKKHCAIEGRGKKEVMVCIMISIIAHVLRLNEELVDYSSPDQTAGLTEQTETLSVDSDADKRTTMRHLLVILGIFGSYCVNGTGQPTINLGHIMNMVPGKISNSKEFDKNPWNWFFLQHIARAIPKCGLPKAQVRMFQSKFQQLVMSHIGRTFFQEVVTDMIAIKNAQNQLNQEDHIQKVQEYHYNCYEVYQLFIRGLVSDVSDNFLTIEDVKKFISLEKIADTMNRSAVSTWMCKIFKISKKILNSGAETSEINSLFENKKELYKSLLAYEGKLGRIAQHILSMFLGVFMDAHQRKPIDTDKVKQVRWFLDNLDDGLEIRKLHSDRNVSVKKKVRAHLTLDLFTEEIKTWFNIALQRIEDGKTVNLDKLEKLDTFLPEGITVGEHMKGLDPRTFFGFHVYRASHMGQGYEGGDQDEDEDEDDDELKMVLSLGTNELTTVTSFAKTLGTNMYSHETAMVIFDKATPPDQIANLSPIGKDLSTIVCQATLGNRQIDDPALGAAWFKWVVQNWGNILIKHRNDVGKSQQEFKALIHDLSEDNAKFASFYPS
jgi:hypothetical protein